MLDKLAEFKLAHPLTVSDLRHHINNYLGLSRVIFYPTSAISQCLCDWVEHVDDNETLYEDKFQADKMFGLKICLTIDRGLQLFLKSCLNAKEIEEVKFTYLDFNFDKESIERGRFICNAPAPLMELFSPSTTVDPDQNGKPPKLRKRNALSGQEGDDVSKRSGVVQNPNKKEEWLLKEPETYKKVFPQSIWRENPPPFFNGTDKRCCPRWYSKGYCFDNCARQHGVMNQETTKQYNNFQNKCRTASK